MSKKVIFIVIILVAFGFSGWAQFTQGNIVVCRIGDKVSPLSINSSPVYLDEYTQNGTFVQSVALPTTQSGLNQALTLPGGSTKYSGLITLSVDGQYLVLPGYNAPVGYVDVNSSYATDIARVVGLIDYNENINTKTALSDWSSVGSVVSATSTDGSNIWCTGQGTANSTGGLRYTTVGATTSTQVNNTRLSLTGVSIVQGQLFVSQGTLVYKAGSGLPTNSGNTLTNFGSLPTTGSFRTQFALFDMDPTIAGVDVLYIADEIRGLSKFSLVGGVWASNGNVGGDADDYRGVTASMVGNTVTLFATRIGSNDPLYGGGELVKITDASGYNGAFAGTPTVLASTPANTATFRGVAFAPAQAPLCSVPVSVASNITPASATLSWNVINGASSYQYALTTTATPPASGTSTSATTYNATGLTQGQNYYFHVRTDCGNFNVSTWNTISFVPTCTKPTITISNDGYIANVKWNSVAGTSSYDYLLTTNPNPPVSGTITSDTSISINSLSSVTQYYIHVRSNCGSGGYSSWSTKAFKTTCLSPIVTISSNGEGKLFKWNKINSAAGYEYALTTHRTPPIGGTSLQDTVVEISKLNTGNSYYFHVRTKCSGSNGESDWATVPFQTTGLDVYPNPVTSRLTIKLYGISPNAGEVIVSDVTGRIVKKLIMNNTSDEIDMSSLSAGVYLIKYSDGTNKHMVKVLKK